MNLLLKQGGPSPQQKVHAKYLMEKYGTKWRDKVFSKQKCPIIFCDNSWLKPVLFYPSSRMARAVASHVIETLCSTYPKKKLVWITPIFLSAQLSFHFLKYIDYFKLCHSCWTF